jgi:hypothetical protein
MDHLAGVPREPDLFAPDAPPCPCAAEGRCSLVIHDRRGPEIASLITLGSCAGCPGHNQMDLFGGPHAGERPRW